MARSLKNKKSHADKRKALLFQAALFNPVAA